MLITDTSGCIEHFAPPAHHAVPKPSRRLTQQAFDQIILSLSPRQQLDLRDALETIKRWSGLE